MYNALDHHAGSHELRPDFLSQRSFYGKAHYASVPQKDGGMGFILTSYETPVATITEHPGQEEPTVELHNVDLYSATTMKHVREFLRQGCGLPNLTKAQILRKFPETDAE